MTEAVSEVLKADETRCSPHFLTFLTVTCDQADGQRHFT